VESVELWTIHHSTFSILNYQFRNCLTRDTQALAAAAQFALRAQPTRRPLANEIAQGLECFGNPRK
jgi:hypothetical protein